MVGDARGLPTRIAVRKRSERQLCSQRLFALIRSSAPSSPAQRPAQPATMSTTAAAPAKKPAAPKKDPGHPTYAVMVKEAIASLKERSGSSLPAITKVRSDATMIDCIDVRSLQPPVVHAAVMQTLLPSDCSNHALFRVTWHGLP